jgi:hypothetical protein
MKNDAKILDLSLVRTMGATYGCDAYGAGTYNTTAVCGTSASSASDNLLADTGYNILLPVAFGSAVLIAGIILLVKKISRRRNAKRG